MCVVQELYVDLLMPWKISLWTLQYLKTSKVMGELEIL